LYHYVMARFCHYVESHIEFILRLLVDGHDPSIHGCSDVCLHYGTMFRSCLRHVTLFRYVVGSTELATQHVFPFLDKFAHDPNFDVASDAMESLRAIFTAGSDPSLAEYVTEFLTRDYQAVWEDRYHPKLLSDQANYMTRRVALQILSTVLLTRSNYTFMIQYVASRKNLVLVMHLLRDTSPHITMDAFHVFKVFVANPNKPPDISKILRDNKEKLCRYLVTLHQDKEANDTQFRDEKALIVATIEAL
jgi:calcium binding protein 39